MACALTQGYTLDCRDSAGGVKEFKIIEFDNVETITVTAGVVTAIVNVTAARWWKYRPAKSTAYAKSTFTGNVQNGSGVWAQEGFMAINKMQTNMRMEISKLVQNTLLLAVKDTNGRNWLYGYRNGVDVTAGESGTGTALADRNGYTLTFTGEESEDAIEIDDATYATLETPGA